MDPIPDNILKQLNTVVDESEGRVIKGSQASTPSAYLRLTIFCPAGLIALIIIFYAPITFTHALLS